MPTRASMFSRRVDGTHEQSAAVGLPHAGPAVAPTEVLIGSSYGASASGCHARSMTRYPRHASICVCGMTSSVGGHRLSRGKGASSDACRVT